MLLFAQNAIIPAIIVLLQLITLVNNALQLIFGLIINTKKHAIAMMAIIM